MRYRFAIVVEDRGLLLGVANEEDAARRLAEALGCGATVIPRALWRASLEMAHEEFRRAESCGVPSGNS